MNEQETYDRLKHIEDTLEKWGFPHSVLHTDAPDFINDHMENIQKNDDGSWNDEAAKSYMDEFTQMLRKRNSIEI